MSKWIFPVICITFVLTKSKATEKQKQELEHDELNSSSQEKKVQIHWHYDKLKLCKHTHIHFSFSVDWQWWQPMVLSTLHFLGSEFCGVYHVLHEKLYVVRTCSRWCQDSLSSHTAVRPGVDSAQSYKWHERTYKNQYAMQQLLQSAKEHHFSRPRPPTTTTPTTVWEPLVFSSLLLLRFCFSCTSTCHVTMHNDFCRQHSHVIYEKVCAHSHAKGRSRSAIAHSFHYIFTTDPMSRETTRQIYNDTFWRGNFFRTKMSFVACVRRWVYRTIVATSARRSVEYFRN